jgi:hypothetical protein
VSAIERAFGSIASVELSHRNLGTHVYDDWHDHGERSMRVQSTNRFNRECLLAIGLLAISGCGGGGGYGGDPAPVQPPQPAAPTVSMTAPSGGSVNRTITLTADATAGAGVNRVEFLVDGSLIASDTSMPYSADWDTSTVPDGSHALTARVVDTASTSVTSSAVTVTVLNVPTIAVSVSAAEVFPRTNSAATGTGQLTFNLVTGAVSGGVTISGINATVAHIHTVSPARMARSSSTWYKVAPIRLAGTSRPAAR